MAIGLGVDALEIDVGLTADGVVVVTHDPLLNPDITRDETGGWLAAPGPPIRGLHHAALARFDVGRIRPGSAYAARFPDQVPCDGARIPTLAEVLALDAGIRLTIEVKTFPARPGLAAAAPALSDALAETVGDAQARVMVQAFDWRVLRHLQRHHPGLALAWLTEPRTAADPARWWDWPEAPASAAEAVSQAGGAVWAPDFAALTERDLADAKRLGLRVLPWTVNETNDMARLIAWGVDGLISDRPDRAIALMSSTPVSSGS